LREIKRYFQINENENSTYQNLRESTKAVLRGKCIALMHILGKEKDLKSIICFYISKLGKKEQIKFNVSRGKRHNKS
jgi:hypothetical protein